jgi:hypothetical protein
MNKFRDGSGAGLVGTVEYVQSFLKLRTHRHPRLCLFEINHGLRRLEMNFGNGLPTLLPVTVMKHLSQYHKSPRVLSLKEGGEVLASSVSESSCDYAVHQLFSL